MAVSEVGRNLLKFTLGKSERYIEGFLSFNSIWKFSTFSFSMEQHKDSPLPFFTDHFCQLATSEGLVTRALSRVTKYRRDRLRQAANYFVGRLDAVQMCCEPAGD